jgi:hypothetical protein
VTVGGVSIGQFAKGSDKWIAVPLMFIVAASQCPVRFFTCPHCGELFSHGTWFSSSWDSQIRMYFARRCKQCGVGRADKRRVSGLSESESESESESDVGVGHRRPAGDPLPEHHCHLRVEIRA